MSANVSRDTLENTANKVSSPIIIIQKSLMKMYPGTVNNQNNSWLYKSYSLPEFNGNLPCDVNCFFSNTRDSVLFHPLSKPDF